MKRTNEIIYSAVSALLRPLVRILLRNSMPFATFADLAKRVYVDVAAKDFSLSDRKQTISRVALLTGLSRKEVLRVTRLAPPSDSISAVENNRAARVISGWVRDERFHDSSGRPAPLPFDGDAGSFSELVREFSGDITPRAVFDELERVGLVERREDETVILTTPAYLPKTESAKLHILGSDASDLISTIDHNLDPAESAPYFQRKVCYQRFPQKHLTALRDLTSQKAQALLEELDRWMAAHDRQDSAPDDDNQHRRAGVSIYYFESDDNMENRHE